MDQKEKEESQAIFDSFCKTVIRNAGRNIHKQYIKQLRNELLVDFSTDIFLHEVAHNDDFPSDRLGVTYAGKEYQVKSLELYEGLTQLPFVLFEVIILKYWCKCTDEQVATLIGVSTKTVRNRKARALNRLRTRWKLEY